MTRFFARRFLSAAALIACIASMTACIEFERSLMLNQNLSGRAGFKFGMNMEPMIRSMLEMQQKMEGKTTPPTQAQMAEAMKEMSDDFNKDKPMDPEAIKKSLPAGVTLVDASQKIDGMRFVVNVILAFDDVRKLKQLKFEEPNQSSGSGKTLNPFEDLEIVDEGQTLAISLRPLTAGGAGVAPAKPGAAPGADQNALNNIGAELGKAMEEMASSPEMKAMVEKITKEMREQIRIELPHTVVTTNATKRTPGVLIWDYNIDTITKMTEAQRKDTRVILRVRK